MAKAPVTVIATHVINPGDRLFEPVNDLLIMLSAVAHAMSIMTGGHTHRSRNPVLRALAESIGRAFALPLRGPLEHALLNKKPTRIEIDEIELASATPPAEPTFHTTGLNDTYHHIVAPIFLGYFERYNVWLTDTHGDAVNWPMTLNFARVVKNSISHGEINIRNPSAPAVSWEGFTYSHSDNGKRIVGDDLKLGEMIALMVDVNAELERLGAPTL